MKDFEVCPVGTLEQVHKLFEAKDELYDNLSNAVDILEGIMEDPEVPNVFKYHYDHQDIHEMKKALEKATEEI